MSDDLHRNGALRLSYATEWVSSLQIDKTQNKEFSLDGLTDAYDWYPEDGAGREYREDTCSRAACRCSPRCSTIPTTTAFYTDQNWQKALGKTTVPTLNVAGFWDQEDPWGSWQIYAQQKKNDPDHLAQIVAGPWNHGGWQGKGDDARPDPARHRKRHRVPDADPGAVLRLLAARQGAAARLHRARCSSRGRTCGRPMPPGRPRAPSRPTSISTPTAALSFTAPAAGEGCRDYVSDPANPVPFRKRPMSRDLCDARLALVGSGRPALRRSPARRAELRLRAARPAT